MAHLPSSLCVIALMARCSCCDEMYGEDQFYCSISTGVFDARPSRNHRAEVEMTFAFVCCSACRFEVGNLNARVSSFLNMQRCESPHRRRVLNGSSTLTTRIDVQRNLEECIGMSTRARRFCGVPTYNKSFATIQCDASSNSVGEWSAQPACVAALPHAR